MDNEETQFNPEPPSPPRPPEPSWTPPPVKSGSKTYLIPAALLIGCLPWVILFLIAFIGIIGAMSDSGGPSEFDKHLILVRIEGEINTGRAGGGFMHAMGAGSETVIDQLKKARKSGSARGVLLRVDSPGGSPAASEEIYNEIMRVRKSGKPVYVSMGDVAASGGYYVSAAADKIYADTSVLTGSIGVIWRSGDVSKLYKMIGYTPNILKAGKYKDINSPARSMTAEEKQMIQRLVDDTYMEFLTAVSKGRKMPLAKVRTLAEGRLYDGKQAKLAGLIDEIGGLEETRTALSKRCGLGSNGVMVEYGRGGLLENLFFGADGSIESFGGSIMRGALKSLKEESEGGMR